MKKNIKNILIILLSILCVVVIVLIIFKDKKIRTEKQVINKLETYYVCSSNYSDQYRKTISNIYVYTGQYQDIKKIEYETIDEYTYDSDFNESYEFYKNDPIYESVTKMDNNRLVTKYTENLYYVSMFYTYKENLDSNYICKAGDINE